jgi:predicted DNA-binding ribbon-helix-helix protein
MASQMPGRANGRTKSPNLKRSIVIAGHKTSVSLEEPFWTCLREIADTQQATMSTIVTGIEASRSNGNLSSAIRTYVLNMVRESGTAAPSTSGP